MPSVSARQHRAMEAAAHGKSTLGIPKKVGKEFARADDNQPMLTTAANAGMPVLRKHAKKLARDSICPSCHGAGCDKCGGSGVAPITRAPMKPKAGAPPYRGARDEWNENDHPRAENGKFGQGSQSTSPGKNSASKSESASGKPSTGSGASSVATSSKSAIKMSGLSKKGGKLGSNEGGLFEDRAGGKFYIKKPATKEHVANERMAAKLYQLAGAATLNYRDVEGGNHVATEWQALEKKNIEDFTPEERKEAAQDFAIHAWLSNWDAAGTGGDNQGVLKGKTTTLDVGGALRFRAQGGPKGGAFGDKVSEWQTMRDKGMSPDAARLFAPMTEGELKSSVERVTAISDDKIRAAVGADKELADRLIARKKDLASKVGLAHDALSAMIKLWQAAREPELAFDRIMVMSVTRAGEPFAFDRKPESVRTTDADGRMHVEVSNISKATVNPYVGKEIPKYKELGLDPDRVYKLLRHPDELKKGAHTFNNLPLLDEHVGVNAENHRPDHVIGSTGTDAAFDGKHLKNSLVIWAGRGIKAVESEKKKELSSAYRYRADMTPGVFEGDRYDGVMRDIVGNHVALVEEGRAGSDVVVGDSSNPLTKPRKITMSKKVLLSRRAGVAYGALMTYLQPQLAMDAKIDLMKPLRGVTGANFKDRRPKIAEAIIKLVDGKLADADMAMDGSTKQGLDEVLDMIQGMPKEAEDEFPDDKPKAGAKDEDMDDDETADDEEMSDEEKAAAAEAEKKKKAAADKKAKDAKRAKDKKAKDAKADVNEEDEEHDPETPEAMDEEDEETAMDTNERISKAIAAERKRNEAISAAKDKVRPRVGNMPGLAFDSAEGVYRKALELSGKDVKKLKAADVSTLEFIFDSLPPAGTDKGRPTYAMDSAAGAGGATADIAKRSPELAKNLARIGHQ